MYVFNILSYKKNLYEIETICRVTNYNNIDVSYFPATNKMATGQLQTGIPPLTQAPPTMSQVDREKIYQWIIELTNPETRENALQELRYALIVFIY